MTLSTDLKLGPYVVLAPLGVGGMGEVYRAKDTRLDRDVAIKVLPEHLARDKDRILRFEREAKVLASLNHPNIGAIHGFETVEARKFLVLEFVEGETLAHRLKVGALPVDEALDVGMQIAEALEAAHEKGLVHRDLKPGNVMIRPDGTVKVLDFGLARAMTDESTSVAAMPDSPTVTSPARLVSPTIPGVIMGTAGYMSPEQARGKPVDKRSDIFSFGCVLYEMLTGRQPFVGETVTDMLGATLHKELDLSLLPARIPRAISHVLARCLVKDRNQRLHDIADARIELELAGSKAEELIATVPMVPSNRRVIVFFMVGALIVTVAAWLLSRPQSIAPRPVIRFALTGIGMPIDAFQGIALSPDGKRLVYRALGDDGREQLHLRSFDSLDVKHLRGSELGWMPFFSPDGERVGFYAAGSLKVIALASGMVRQVAMIDRGGYSGAVWLPDDTIIFAGSSNQFGRVNATGGKVESLEVKGMREGEFVISPSALPGGDALLCGVGNGSIFSIAVYDIKERSLTPIAENGFTPAYAPSGHVVYQQGQSGPLMALPFDLKRRMATGEPFPVISDPGTRVSYQVRMFTIGADGTLAYIPQSALLDNGALTWVDRMGEATPIVEIPRVIDTPRLSHDGRQIAFRSPAPECNIWVHDLESGVTTRVTREGDNHGVAWSRDDANLFFARLQVPEQWAVMSTAANGAGNVEAISAAVIPRGFVSSISADGEHILVDGGNDSGADDVYLVDTKERSVKPLLNSRYVERAAVFSPDARYIAYVSEASGRAEVYVQSYPEAKERRQISTEGGSDPAWSRDGKELFFRSDRKIMVVDVIAEPNFSAGRPRTLFETRYPSRGSSGLTNYDVAPDGKHFVMVRERSTLGGATINIVVNWLQVLEAMAPARGKH
mgnify:FL=1